MEKSQMHVKSHMWCICGMLLCEMNKFTLICILWQEEYPQLDSTYKFMNTEMKFLVLLQSVTSTLSRNLQKETAQIECNLSRS